MASQETDILYKGNSVISVETFPDYSHPVVVKKPSSRYPSPHHLRSLAREYEMTRSLDGVDGVRQALEAHTTEDKPVLIL